MEMHSPDSLKRIHKIDAVFRSGHRPSIAIRLARLIVAAVTKVLRAQAAYNQAWRDYEDLLDLPEHMLRDVGLNKSDVIAQRERLSWRKVWTEAGDD